MLREMSGRDLEDWRAHFAIVEEERRDEALDQKGKASLRRLMGR